MPTVAAAVCPHPPVLVPHLASGAAAELDDLRAACDAVLASLFAAGPDLLVVVGADVTTRQLEPPYAVSFARWGGGAEAATNLPLSVLVAAWLLDRQPVSAPALCVHTIAVDAPVDDCVRLGKRLAGPGERVALLAMGDGSARRGLTSPGYDDPRAEPFDAAVAEALAAADPQRLCAIEPRLATELMAAGRAPWQVLAGACADRSWTGVLRYCAAPYGVAYFAAEWS